jgi:DNA primase
VNSPETPLYNKSKILYGYDKAKREILKENFCVIVEGQMDLLMAHQSGSANTVACSGTALTEEHIRLIKRFTETIKLSFDADPAGLKAGERGVALALVSGMDVRMVKLPEGLDPADVILKDANIWKNALVDAKHIVDFLLEHIEEKKTDERNFRLEVGKHVLPYVADIANKIDQAHFMKKIASKLMIPEEDIRTEVDKLLAERVRTSRIQGGPTLGNQVIAKSLRRQIEQKIWGIYLWQKENFKSTIDFEKFMKEYSGLSGKEIDEDVKNLELATKNDLIFQAEMYYPDEDVLNSEISELFINFEKEVLEEKLSGAMQILRQAEQSKNDKDIGEILKKCHEISKRINDIKNSRYLEK